MEPGATYKYSATASSAQARTDGPQGREASHRREAHLGGSAPTLDPPMSKKVLDGLAERLTLPHSIALLPSKAQVRKGAYDKLAAHCLQEAHKPEPDMLWAYTACTEIIRHHSKSFYFSARLLPPGKRHGVMALYAFCRRSDDTVDNADTMPDRIAARTEAAESLDQWARLNSLSVGAGDNTGSNPVVVAWADTRHRFSIPQELPEELLAGVRMDLTISRYETWDDLWLYCYRVASTVGLMSMYITGATTMAAIPYAVQLGVALQLTNILRDVGEDARAGRIYLPAEDMARFGYTEEMLLEGVINPSFIKLMEFEIERAHALYNASWRGIAMLPPDSRVAVGAAATVYRGILGKIRASSYDVYNKRAHLSMGEKVRALPLVWWRAKRLKPDDGYRD